MEYSDQKPPTNRYPHRIISPSRAADCCFSDMEKVGTPQQDGHWVYQYRRCRQCGFAVRVILREIPDMTLAKSLRATVARPLVRNIPE